MGQGLKQRLLGAVVLLGLLIILAPALFRGGESHPMVLPDSEQTSGSVEMVKAPPVPEFVKTLDVPPEPVSVAIPVEEAVPAAQSRNNVGTDKEGFLKSWALRLGTFSDQRNAENLKKTLKEKGLTTYVRKVASGQGKVFYRVYVGPEVRPDELETLKLQLKKELKLEGMVVRFEP